MTCSHCIEARPAVIALSKRYPLEGRNVGTVAADGYPFPIKPADKKQSKEVYGIKGVPALAVFINNVFRQKISGANDIQDARIIVQALADKAMTVTEAAKITNTNEYIITGWLMARGQYFKSSQYYLSDRTTDIPVKAWLPTESVKRPQSSTGPRLMASVVRKPVILKGNFQKTEAGTLFVVKEELPVD